MSPSGRKLTVATSSLCVRFRGKQTIRVSAKTFFILDFGTAKAIRTSLELPAQEPEPLAHAPPETLELIAEFA